MRATVGHLASFHLCALAAPLLALSTACSPLPEVAYVTERVELAPDFDAPVCAGTLDDLDAQVDRIEEELGRTTDPRAIRVYWLEGSIADQCGDGRSGCYFPSTRILFAEGWSIDHELVHAVLDSEGQSYFLEEGLAELLSGIGVVHDPDPDELGPAARLRLSPSEYRKGALDYAGAAHFMHFVHKEAGTAAVRRLGREIERGASAGAIESVLEEVMHDSVDTIETRYQTVAPSYYPGISQSRVPLLELHELADGFEVDLDCGDPMTRGPRPGEESGMYQVYRLVIPWAGVAAVQVQGDGDGWLDILDPYARLHRGWVTDWNRPDRSLDPGATHIEAGERIQLELDEGTHLLVFATDEPGPVRLQVSVQLPWKGGPRRLE